MSKLNNFIKDSLCNNRDRFKLWFPVLFGLGIGLYFLPEQEPSKWFTLGMIEILILLAIIFRYHPTILKILLIFTCVVAGFANIQIQTIYRETLQRTEIPSYSLYVRGQIDKTGYNIKGKQRLIFNGLEDFDGKKINGTFRITLRDKEENFKVGECVEMAARLQPLAKAVIPEGYQFDRKNFYEGYSGSGYAISPVYRVECSLPSSNTKINLLSWREKIVQHIFKVLPPEQAAITATLITGEKSLIPQEIINNYRDSGLAHFLSISGLHMSMIAGLMFFMTRFILALIPSVSLRFDTKKISALMAIVISAVYLGLSGAEVPAIRAFVMTFVVLLGVLFNRRAISMYTIAIAATIILVLYPHALVGAGFQMSFAAVVCLVAFYERYTTALQNFISNSNDNLFFKSVKIILLYFIGILISDFIASLATLPFAVYHFNRIALYTSLANLLAAPLIGFVIMPFVLVSLLLIPVGLGTYPLHVVGFGVLWVNRITEWVSSLDGASYLIMSEPLWGLLLVVFGGLWLCIWQGKIRNFGWIAIAIGILSVGTVNKPDILISADAKVLALRDNKNRLVVLPSRGKHFIKQQWLDKTASKPLDAKEYAKLKQIYKGKITDSEWLDLVCNKSKCVYKKKFQLMKNGKLILAGKPLNLSGSEGMVIYMGKNLRTQSIREYIGQRLWNKN